MACHLLVLLCMFVLYSLSVSLCQGMTSKALLMSIAGKSVLCADLFELMPSKTCCVRLVSEVLVECKGWNPCYVGAWGTSGWIIFSIRCSVILDHWENCLHSFSGIGCILSKYTYKCYIIYVIYVKYNYYTYILFKMQQTLSYLILKWW